MPATFNASNNSISVSSGSQTIFDTSRRMPHIISSVSGTFNSTDASITSGANGTYVSRVSDNYVHASSIYTFSNSFAWAWLKITNNANRTDIMVDNPIFVTGSILLRFYIGNQSLRGSYVLTPMVYNGYLGFREEWQFANPVQTSVPSGLYPTDPTNTNGNLGLTYSYTIYYGRFI